MPAELLGEGPHTMSKDGDIDQTGVENITLVENQEVGHNECDQILAAWALVTPLSTKRKPDDGEGSPKPLKKHWLMPPSMDLLHQLEHIPQGLIWHNNSCTYDAVLTVLYNLWVESCEAWSENFNTLNTDYLGILAQNFTAYEGALGGLKSVGGYCNSGCNE